MSSNPLEREPPRDELFLTPLASLLPRDFAGMRAVGLQKDCTSNVPSRASKVQEITMTFGKPLRWSYLGKNNWTRLTSVGCLTTAMLLGGCGYFQLGGSDAASLNLACDAMKEKILRNVTDDSPKLARKRII